MLDGWCCCFTGCRPPPAADFDRAEEADVGRLRLSSRLPPAPGFGFGFGFRAADRAVAAAAAAAGAGAGAGRGLPKMASEALAIRTTVRGD